MAVEQIVRAVSVENTGLVGGAKKKSNARTATCTINFVGEQHHREAILQSYWFIIWPVHTVERSDVVTVGYLRKLAVL